MSLRSPFLLAAAVSLSCAVLPAHAEDQTVRIRGTVTSLTGDKLAVKSREGKDVAVTLAPNWSVSAVAKASLADIKPGDYVGIASLPTSAGGDGALEVLVFPPAMKGAGEGSYGWDLQPNSSMTNGSVTDAVKAVDGNVLTVTYKGQSKKITVPPGTPVVTLIPATAADVKPGTAVFINAKSDGTTTTTGRITVGKDGVVPPM